MENFKTKIKVIFITLFGFVSASPYALALEVKTGKFQHVVIVVLENTEYEDALAQPFLKELAKRGALLTNFFAEGHPSQGNYIAMIAGSTMNVISDDPITLEGQHIGDLLEAKGLSWGVYADDYPGHCFLGARYRQYARKHNPFISFRNVQSSPARCARITDSSDFLSDWREGRLPNFSFYVPGMDNDGHDTSVAYADRWLARKFGPLLNTPQMLDTLLVITFDEDNYLGENRIYTALVGANIKPGTKSNASYNHYNILSTVETAYGLGSLNQLDSQADGINDVWQ